MKNMWPTLVALTFGLLAIPISYTYTQICISLSFTPVAMFAFAATIMTAVLLITSALTIKHVKNRMYYGFALFVFSGIIDILSGLEMDGIINGFLTLYLKHGEPYLVSAWGVMASYWDGTVNLICYLLMAYSSSNGLSYRTVGLFWSSGILNSMIVLLLGACLSESGMSWCTLLNVPYVLFPLLVAVQSLSEIPALPHQPYKKRFWIDKLLIFLLIEAAVAALLKGLATFDCNQSIISWYRTMAEPILQEQGPAPFAGVQGLVTLFYFFPCYVAIAWGIMVNPTQLWLRDLSVILTGATLQAGGCTIGMTIHHLTKPLYKMPPAANHSAFCAFWAVNLLLCGVPLMVAIRLLNLPLQQEESNNKKASKKIKQK